MLICYSSCSYASSKAGFCAGNFWFPDRIRTRVPAFPPPSPTSFTCTLQQPLVAVWLLVYSAPWVFSMKYAGLVFFPWSIRLAYRFWVSFYCVGAACSHASSLFPSTFLSIVLMLVVNFYYIPYPNNVSWLPYPFSLKQQTLHGSVAQIHASH